MIAEAVVHTTGINWASVLTIIFGSVGCLSVILGFMGRFLAHYVSDRITGAIDKLRIDVLTDIASRVLVLETLAGIKTSKETEEADAVRSAEKGRQRRMGNREHGNS